MRARFYVKCYFFKDFPVFENLDGLGIEILVREVMIDVVEVESDRFQQKRLGLEYFEDFHLRTRVDLLCNGLFVVDDRFFLGSVFRCLDIIVMSSEPRQIHCTSIKTA